MGGRGARSSSGGGGISSGDILSTDSLVSARNDGIPGHKELADQTLDVFKDINKQYDYVIGDIELATVSPKAAGVMAYYDGSNIAVNKAYFSDKMTTAYKDCVKRGFHPSNGSKTPMQAVVAHEAGHALTDAAADKMGITGAGKLDKAATQIVTEARKQTRHRGVVQMAGKISGYATHSNAEAIAEAFSDVYCNGGKAKKESKAIYNVLNSYLK